MAQLTFTRLADAYGIDGVTPVEQHWQASDQVTGVTISKSYPLANTQASIEADLTTLFPANPVVAADRLQPLYALKQGDETVLVDATGKPLLAFKREPDGGVEVKGYDATGNAASYTRTQRVTMEFRGTKVATATFPVPFLRVPSVAITLLDSSAQPPYKAAVTKTQVTVKFGSAYTGRIEVNIGE